MSKLLAQRKMIKSLDDFYKNVSYTHPSSRNIRLLNIAKDAIPESDFSGHLSTKLNKKDSFIYFLSKKHFNSPNYILNRSNKLNRLYKSCVDDGFIEKVERNIYDSSTNQNIKITDGIRVSTLGTDLLHPVGFFEIMLKKYPTPKLIIYTIITTLLSTEVLIPIILKVIHNIK